MLWGDQALRSRKIAKERRRTIFPPFRLILPAISPHSSRRFNSFLPAIVTVSRYRIQVSLEIEDTITDTEIDDDDDEGEMAMDDVAGLVDGRLDVKIKNDEGEERITLL